MATKWLFSDSKSLPISKVQKGIKTFDINKCICLPTNLSKDGIGYLLLQQHYSCPPTNAPLCWPDGWHLVFAGSWFNTEAESRYAPTEGAFLVISWSLNNAHMFILRCKELIAVTDHKQLLETLNNREINSIPSWRLQFLKEKTMQYELSTQYCPGKWQQGADVVSWYPCIDSTSFLNIICSDTSLFHMKNTVSVTKSWNQNRGPCYLLLPIFLFPLSCSATK